VYHSPGSRSNRVVWLLEELGEPYDVVVLDLDTRRGGEHRTRHPLGRVPVIDDGDGPIFESAAICLQLADLNPAAELIPPVGSHERALVYQWVLFAMTELERANIDARVAGDDAERAGPARERLREIVGAFETALAGRDYLVGDRFTVADVVSIAVMAAVRRVGAAELGPNVTAYLERVETRPAYQRSLAVGAPA
jgi:glutathione S-transferase